MFLIDDIIIFFNNLILNNKLDKNQNTIIDISDNNIKK